MTPKKEFQIASIAMIFLAVIDVGNLALDIGELTTQFGVIGYGVLALAILIALAKLYMGVMGLKYCKGTGKGKLHITLAIIGLVFTVIGAVNPVINVITGAGAMEELIGIGSELIFMFWYLGLAKKHLA